MRGEKSPDLFTSTYLHPLRLEMASMTVPCALMLFAIFVGKAASADPPLPRDGWSITASSEEIVGEGGAAANIIDGNEDTIWHTEWAGGEDILPHTLTIVMGGQVNTVSGIAYLPRQDKDDNGIIGQFEVGAVTGD